MEDTLDAALSQIFGGQVSASGDVVAPSQPEATAAARAPALAQTAAQMEQFQALAREASQHSERALQLQRQGDWAGSGQEIKKLGDAINKLATQQN